MSDIDARFEKWWDDDVLFPSKYIDPILLEEDDSPIYWAHQGWQAGYESQQAEITRLNEVVSDSEARVSTILITIEKMSKHKELSQQQRDVLIGVHSALVEAMSEKGDK